jgi:multiple sugar transport system substrate-binding protein
MRKFSLLVSLFVALFLVSSMVSAQDMSNVDPSGQNVVYWHQFSDAQLETMTALVEGFNSTNEWGITVEAIGQGNYNDIRELMNASIVSGELPNLVAGFGSDAASYARDGAALDLMPFMNDAMWGLSEEQNADFLTGLLAPNTTDEGELLAWPHQSSAQVLVSNMTLLNELGYDAPPASIEEFREIACASANSVGANGEDRLGFPLTTDPSMLESFIANQGGVIFADGAYTFTNDAVVGSLQLYADLFAEGCGYIPAERFAEQTDFGLGLVPFISTSTAGFTFVLAAFETAGAEANLMVSTFPHAEGSEALQVFVPSIIMVGGTPEQQLASWLFLEYLISPEAGAAWSQGTGYFNPVPSTAALLTEETFPNTALFPYFNAANELLNNADIVKYAGPQIVSYGAVRGLVSEAIANVTSNGMTVADAAAALQAAADQALADSAG